MLRSEHFFDPNVDDKKKTSILKYSLCSEYKIKFNFQTKWLKYLT